MPWLETTTVATPNGTDSRALVAADLAHVASAVNLGRLGFHVWPYLAARPEFTDEPRLDSIRSLAREKVLCQLSLITFVGVWALDFADDIARALALEYGPE